MAEYFARSYAVMEVEVGTVTQGDSAMHGEHYRARFKVLNAYKGPADQFHYLKTVISHASCGIDLKQGQTLWIFGYRKEEDPRGLWVDSCGGNRMVGQPIFETPAKAVRPALEKLSGAQTSNADNPAHGAFINPACWDKPRIFHTGTPEPDALRKVTLEKSRSGKHASDPSRETKHDTGTENEWMPSTNGAYRFVVRNPNPTARPPRIATITVETERDYQLSLKLHGVAKPVQPKWINEKLISLRAWWDARTGTDVIVDVEAETIIHQELVRTGESVFGRAKGQPCSPD